MLGGMSSVVVQFPGTRVERDVEPLCASHDPDWWFEPAMFDKAAEICRACSMRSGCLDRALQSGERIGVWGGLTPEQRAALPNAVVIPLRRRPRSGG
jgi:WhiB family redox-sensing transcriptional regulator